MRTLRARFSRGKIEPLEKVDIAEGREISVTIMEVLRTSNGDAFERSAGSWKGTIDAEKLIENNVELLLTRLPPQLRPVKTDLR